MQTYPKIIDYIPLPLFTHLLTATLLITISGSVSMSLFVLFCFVFRFHIWVKPYGICVCLPDFFHLAYYPVRPAMFLHRARFHSFLLPCNISVCVNHIFFIHTSMDGHLGWNIFQKRSDPGLSKYKKIEIIWSIFSDHNGMKLQICKKEKWGKKYRWRLNNMLLNSQWIEEEIKQEIKNF